MTDLIRNNLSQSLLYNTPRSGSFIIDTFISIILAATISYIFTNGRQMRVTISNSYRRLIRYFGFNDKQKYYRNISFLVFLNKKSEWIESPDLTQCENSPLVYAIFHYLREHNIKMRSNDVVLTIKNSNTEDGTETDYDRYLNRTVTYIPEESIECKVNDKLDIKYTINVENMAENVQKKISITLISSDKDYLDNFISNCYTQYLNECHKKVDDKKYLYNINTINSIERTLECDRYELVNTKTFDKIFIPEKKAIKSLIDNFLNKSGPFKNDIFQHKLGWILYGKPGCGKTTLIKAISNYTKRHIININLAQIETNNELFSIFNNLKIKVGYDKVNYNLKDVIYVIDDIDAIENIIKERSNINTKKKPKIRKKRHVSESDIDSESNSDTDFSESGFNDKGIIKKINRTKNKNKLLDKLNLQGILNVLDGTLDAPGRIIIMTTNHIDKLDQALKRPGRVNQVLKFDLMSNNCIRQFLKSNFPTIGDEKLDNTKFKHKEMTPAEVEEICIENYSDTNKIIELLTKL